MQNTIKTHQKIAALACLAIAITLAGSSCNSTTDKSGSDTTAVKDSASLKVDSAIVVKKDSDSAAMKMAPMDSLASPASHKPQKDTSTTPRPIDRKTRAQ